MEQARVTSMDDISGFANLSDMLRERHPHLRVGRCDVDGEELLRSEWGGVRILWLYRGSGEVFLAEGHRTNEGDGAPLPEIYAPDQADEMLLRALDCIEKGRSTLAPSVRAPVASILSRRQGNLYIGHYGNELWKLEHAAEPWSSSHEVVDALRRLYGLCRSAGYSTKQLGSYEPIMAGDQLVLTESAPLAVRGTFSCLSMEYPRRTASHVPAVTRLRYLKDSSGGCNFDFDPFRRLPLTWSMDTPGSKGDGVNFVNSHVVNIAHETSPTHFHPSTPIGGGQPQNELYLVLDPRDYHLGTYGRDAKLLTFPDLHRLDRVEAHALSPGSFAYIPAGVGHRGLDVFVNVITIPGFKPHNEYYIDQEIRDAAHGAAPFNEDLTHLKNYDTLDALI